MVRHLDVFFILVFCITGSLATNTPKSPGDSPDLAKDSTEQDIECSDPDKESCPATSPDTKKDYCVIGAGPGGLQMGYFLQRANRDYIIFERSNTTGSFFVKYPRHRKLISINKIYTGKTNKEFNLRHDWNSLISDDESLLMK